MQKGLDIPIASTDFDNVISQKISVIKAYMKGAGVSDNNMDSDLAMGVIVLGVSDIWDSKAGEVKLSPVFNAFLIQLRGG